MTDTCTMPMNHLMDVMIEKAETIIAAGAACGAGIWGLRNKWINDKLANAQIEQTAVETIISVAKELRTDLTAQREEYAAIKAELAKCHESKEKMQETQETQGRVINDLTKHWRDQMKAQGLPDHVNLTINPDHILPPKV